MPKTLSQLVSTVTTGTAPLVVASTTLVTNLHANNSDQWGGLALPAIAGNGGKTLAVNTGATALEWVTGSSSLVIGPYSFNYNSGTNKLELIYTA